MDNWYWFDLKNWRIDGVVETHNKTVKKTSTAKERGTLKVLYESGVYLDNPISFNVQA